MFSYCFVNKDISQINVQLLFCKQGHFSDKCSVIVLETRFCTFLRLMFSYCFVNKDISQIKLLFGKQVSQIVQLFCKQGHFSDKCSVIVL